MAENKPPVKEESLSDIVLYPFRKWIDFIKIKGIDYFLGLLKISLCAMLVPFLLLSVFVLFVTAIGYAVGIDNITNIEPWVFLLLTLAFIAVWFVFFFVLVWLASTLQLTSLSFTHSRIFEKPFSIWDTFSKIKYKVLKQILILVGIYVAVYIPILVLTFFMMFVMLIMFAGSYGLPELGGILMIVVMLLYLILYLVSIAYSILVYAFYAFFGFITQFWVLEFVVASRGVIDALKASFNIIRANLLETFLFNIIWVFVSGILMLPLFVIAILLYIMPYIAPLTISALGQTNGLIVLAIAGLLLFLLCLVFGALMGAFSLPTQYLFWTKARKRVQ